MSSKNDSRQNILSVATRLFHLQGYHATGLNQILKESGAPKGSLYYHFPNGKEQLAIEAVKRMDALIKNDIVSSLEKYESAIEAIQIHIQKIAADFTNDEKLECVPIGILVAETAQISESIRETCKAAVEGWEELYCSKLIGDGFEPDLAKKLGVTINSMIEGAVTRSLINKDSQPLQQLAECIPVLLKR
ncbi:transcriptional regulator, TetR family [Fontibacillus panacisegetis]|uniref:Transcriptional regulator, TetR family n=1 Tax=Fontibacillus panacisegetis TaxID=670482 RepID=A0A1G7NWZ3_9BACL|nr:TetR/AcrR family transcriptional regulator [Fontibacillus panacisegetis]SDF77879.1 transcriptional regulator, TetR family [Fontibacillus panacisegetis]